MLGIGDASGMFPINEYTRQYDSRILKEFDELISGNGFGSGIVKILPKVLLTGADAGELTQQGAKLLDPSGVLMPGIPMCPPEGGADTGVVVTNSVEKHTGKISAGTSAFFAFHRPE